MYQLTLNVSSPALSQPSGETAEVPGAPGTEAAGDHFLQNLRRKETRGAQGRAGNLRLHCLAGYLPVSESTTLYLIYQLIGKLLFSQNDISLGICR